MKDYQLYLEKIVNALSRAGISYPAPSFTTYEGMWSYVEGLGSFLEMNAQLQKSGAGIVLMGLEESTTFKTYWNSEFYQEFQERKFLESKISSENENIENQEEYAEFGVSQNTEILEEEASSGNHLAEAVGGIATGLVVGSVASSSNGLDMSNVIFSDDDEDEEDYEYLDDDSDLEDDDSDWEEEEEVVTLEENTSGFDMSNVVFSDDEDDEEDESDDDDFYEDFVEDDTDEGDFEEDISEGFNVESSHGVSKEELKGYDFSNVIFSDEGDDDDSDSLSDEEEYEYDEDGFIIDRSEPEEDEEEDDEFYEDTSDGYTYDEDGFVIDADEPIIEDDEDDFEDVDNDFEEDVVHTSPHTVSLPKEKVSKPKHPKLKELQETDKILSIFGSLEGKLRKKVKDVKDKSKN